MHRRRGGADRDWTVEMQDALNALVAAGLLVSQELVDEEPDALTGRRGGAFRLTLAGQRVLDFKSSRHPERAVTASNEFGECETWLGPEVHGVAGL